jgi:hypothetical protein
VQGLKSGAVPGPDALPSFQQLQAAVGFPQYYAEEARYAVPSSATRDAAAGSTASGTFGRPGAGAASSSGAAAAAAGVEPDLVLEPGAAGSSPEAAAAAGTIDLYAGRSTDGGDGGGGSSGAYRSRGAAAAPQWVRVRITDTWAGKTTLDTRFPAGRPLAARSRLQPAALPRLAGGTAARASAAEQQSLAALPLAAACTRQPCARPP